MRTIIPMNLDWRFHLGEKEKASYKGYDDSAWEKVTIPHDWAVTLPFDESCSSGTGYLPGGVGWYRKHFTLPELSGRKVFVTFNGVYKHGRVWINSNYLGMRAYGYSTFTYDITEFATPGDNVLSVRCEHNDLADSRWFTGNGIYRDVTIILTSPDHFALDGVFAHTSSASEGEAVIEVSAEIAGDGETSFTLMDAKGHPVAEGAKQLTVKRPRLWAPKSPYMYTLVGRLIKDGMAVDEVRIPFGIRTFRFDADKGFFLNGANVKFKGVCIHHDAGVLGAAVPKTVWARRLRKFKEAGCNAIRFSHNPPSPDLLDLCDEMGFLAMDEAFDEWEGCKNKWWQGHNVYPPKLYGYSDDFPQWHEKDLADLVRRDRNHPSIVMWSIGNEIDYPNDPYVHPLFAAMTGNNDANKPEQERVYDTNKPNAQRLATIAGELCAIVKKHDATRPVTSALALPELSNLTGYAQALDVVGYNYKEHLYNEDHKKYPGHILLGSENGHHTEAWLAVAQNDYISGQFLWTGIDFLGEAHGWPVRISQAGMIDMAGFEKPRFALRQALWTDTLCAHLAVCKKEELWRSSAPWTGTPGETMHVTVLTNGESAQLTLNGKQVGAAKVDEHCIAEFEVPYAPGTLAVVCARGKETSSASLTTPQEAVKIEAIPDVKALPADGQAVFQVEVALRDASGNIAAADDRMICCQIVGGAVFLGLENGSPSDLTSYASATRSTYHGRAIIYVRAGRTVGKAELHLRAEGLPEMVVALNMTKAGNE
jgi:beta-galactosidase/beta-glucuronidase